MSDTVGQQPPPTRGAPTQIVHLDAESRALPSCPPGYTRFVLISDSHAHTFKVPDGDILLHAGDLTEYGTPEELAVTLDWLASLPHKHKVLIAGNHDHCLDEALLVREQETYERRQASRGKAVKTREYTDMYVKSQRLLGMAKYRQKGLVYLKDEVCEIIAPDRARSSNCESEEGGDSAPRRKTWRIWGSPWSAAFFSMAFNVPRGESSAELYAEVPDDIDILMSHGPPYGIHDRIIRGKRSVGCEHLLARTRAIQPRLHVWGHIHEDRGVTIGEPGSAQGSSSSSDDAQQARPNSRQDRPPTVFVNAANAGTFARPVVWGTGEYQPIVVDLRNDAETGNGSHGRTASRSNL